MFKLRCEVNAHPQIRALFRNILEEFAKHVPEVFEDLAEAFCLEGTVEELK